MKELCVKAGKFAHVENIEEFFTDTKEKQILTYVYKIILDFILHPLSLLL
jgi:hypothetical protein